MAEHNESAPATPRAAKQAKLSADDTAPAAASASAAAASTVDVDLTESSSPPTTVQSAAHVSLTPSFTSASFRYADGANTKYLLCGLCQLPLFKPVEHSTCRLPFCSACVQGGPQCPECNVPIRLNKTNAPTKTVQLQLDDLPVLCGCGKELLRGAYEAHWRDECPQLCPFAEPAASEDAAVCSVSLPRSQLNAHIDSCPFAPVRCSASDFGCVWQGQREAQATHATSCPHVICTPDFRRLLTVQSDELRRVRATLETVQGQLQSYKALAAAGNVGRVAYPLGTVVDCEDTERQWLLAKIIKVDAPKQCYKVSYLGWDQSWDEWLPFDSRRLAPAGTHTTQADVDKHADHIVTGTLCGSVEPAAHDGDSLMTTPPNSQHAASSKTVGLSGNKRKK